MVFRIEFYILNSLDTVMKLIVCGHRLDSAEVEATINFHPKVAESAVFPYPHSMKGSTIFAYATLMQGVEKAEELKAEIVRDVRNFAGRTVKPEVFMFTDALPKTRSGKIMRRVLKAIATMGEIGDVMTLANPEVVQSLVDERAKLGEIIF